MKRTLVIFGIAVAVVGLMVVSVFAGATLVRAQASTPEAPNTWGMHGGMMGGMRGGMMDGDHPMEEYMHAALAEKLGVSETELESLNAEGKTFWQIAEEKGLTSEEATTLMQEARGAALAQMVAAGKITQEQADWMQQRGSRMMGQGGCPMADGDETAASGFRGGRGGRGMMGR